MSLVDDPRPYTQRTEVRRVGESGLHLPLLSLGMWQNFGDDRPRETQRELITGAFDRGIFHFDLANNYGPPYGSAERNFGQILASDLAAHRDEILISTKAGWDMWPGHHGAGASRKHLITSLDRSLERIGVDSVDVFYTHRPDPRVPLEETARALDHIVRTGRAHYIGMSSYGAEASRELATMMRDLGTPITIHQPSYNMLNRWIETEGLLDVAREQGFGVIGFTALAQGMLTNKYLDGMPEGARGAAPSSFSNEALTDEVRDRLRGIAKIAASRGQSLAQLALAWALRDTRVSSLVVGASRLSQLDENWRALENLTLSTDEITQIDGLLAGLDVNVDLWRDARLGGDVPVLV
ncbi:L-glyceraldehyde 3-phosphate reductase [Leucobacter exalbidus]|uniref:L-glyceraldehyde 3-phosphate reductase n=1 Tax=Leucobacter exalbidus TaxID=662960 RepID=A0A940T578_9MICO|nr:aldo/keto reductase [Leucobacter exalbidus]MBP1327569.1 L-glyceraldehyde 3-phosphate reductase [Leucobacter exalbidus]